MSDNTPDSPIDEGSINDEGSPAQKSWLKRIWAHDNFLMRIVRFISSRLVRFFAEVTAAVLGVAFVWFCGLNYILSEKQVDISFLGDNASQWFSTAFNSKSADIGDLSLIWHPGNDVILFKAKDVVIKDENDVALQSVTEFKTYFDFNKLLFGEFDVKRLKISGGALTLKRDEAETVYVGLGVPASIEKLGITLKQGDTSSQTQDSFNLGPLDKIEAENSTVYVQDAVTGFDLVFADTDLSLAHDQSVYIGSIQTHLKQAEGRTPIQADMVFSPDYEDFELAFATQGLNPTDVLPSSGKLSRFNWLDMPLNVDLNLISDRDVGLSEISLNAHADAGKLNINKQPYNVEKGVISATYDKALEKIIISELSIKSDILTSSGTGTLSQIGTPSTGFFKQTTTFDIDLNETVAEISSTFKAPFELNNIALSGSVYHKAQTVNFDEMAVDFETFQLSSQINVGYDNDNRLRHIKGAGKLEGDLVSADLLALWPMNFADGAKRWIERSVIKGFLTDINFRLDINEDDLQGGPLPNEAVTVNFKTRDAEVRYISTMTPYTNITGSGVLRGNSFDVNVIGGHVGSLEVVTGHIEIPRLSPKGGDINIDVQGQGNIPDMLALIDQDPFKFSTRFGIEPEKFSGQGKVDVTITRPLLEFFDPNRITYAVTGDFTDVTVPFKFGSYSVNGGALSLVADKTSMTIQGPINVGPWPVSLIVEDTFDLGETPIRYRVSGIMDRDALDGFGIGFREYFTGQMDVDIDATGTSVAITQADISADLMQAELYVGQYWQKPVGAPGQLQGVLKNNPAGVISFSDLSVTAPGLSLAGYADFASDMKLINFEVSEAQIDGLINARLGIKPNPTGDLFDVGLSGSFLDVSPFVSRAMTRQASGIALPIKLEANVEALVLNEMFVLNQATIDFYHTGTDISHLSLSGATPDGPMRLGMLPMDDTSNRKFIIDIPDTTAAIMAFLDMDNIKGKRLYIDAIMPGVGETGPVAGTLTVDNFVLSRAPVMAQMLSMASLTGLTDTLAGSGLSFKTFDVPFSYEEGRLSVRNARVSGPAIGMTGNGDVDLKAKTVDLDGVLVPAYTVNSALEGVPLIGDLVVGKKGEGILALNYSIIGPFKQTQITVNPFSALTPGVLRRIFDKERKTLDDLAKETLAEDSLIIDDLSGDDVAKVEPDLIPAE